MESQKMFSTVNEGDDFFIAIHVHPKSDLTELRKFLMSVPDMMSNLKAFRLTVVAFSGRLEEVRIYHPSTRRNVGQFLLDPVEWADMKPSIDPVVNLVYDPGAAAHRKVFVYTDVPLTTFWNTHMLSMCLKFHWLKERGLDIG